MKILATVIAGAFILSAAAGTDSGRVERIVAELLPVLPVLWAALRWARTEKTRRAEDRQKAEAEHQRREKLYIEIESMHTRLAGAKGQPCILDRMEKAEGQNVQIIENQQSQRTDNNQHFDAIEGRLSAIENRIKGCAGDRH